MTRSTPARLYQDRSKITTSPAGGEVRHVALEVHLGLLAFGGRRERDDPEHPGADPLGDPLDHAALAGAVAPLEHHAHLGAGAHDPLLEVDQLDLQLLELGLVPLAAPAASADPCHRHRHRHRDSARASGASGCLLTTSTCVPPARRRSAIDHVIACLQPWSGHTRTTGGASCPVPATVWLRGRRGLARARSRETDRGRLRHRRRWGQRKPCCSAGHIRHGRTAPRAGRPGCWA